MYLVDIMHLVDICFVTSLQPICSIHVNLLYGAVYRVSPSERLLSSKSAHGLVLALGTPMLFLNTFVNLFTAYITESD